MESGSNHTIVTTLTFWIFDLHEQWFFHCVSSSLLYMVAVRSLASTIVTHSLSKDSQLLPRKRNRLLEEQYLNDQATLIGDGNWLWKTYVWYQLILPASSEWPFGWFQAKKKSGAKWSPFGESKGHGWKELVKKKVFFIPEFFESFKSLNIKWVIPPEVKRCFRYGFLGQKYRASGGDESFYESPAAPGEWAQRSFHWGNFFLLLFIGERLKFLSSSFLGYSHPVWDVHGT